MRLRARIQGTNLARPLCSQWAEPPLMGPGRLCRESGPGVGGEDRLGSGDSPANPSPGCCRGVLFGRWEPLVSPREEWVGLTLASEPGDLEGVRDPLVVSLVMAQQQLSGLGQQQPWHFPSESVSCRPRGRCGEVHFYGCAGLWLPGGSCPGDGAGGAGLWPAGTSPPAQYAVRLWCLV